jgi:hypothetical protein
MIFCRIVSYLFNDYFMTIKCSIINIQPLPLLEGSALFERRLNLVLHCNKNTFVNLKDFADESFDDNKVGYSCT